MFSQDLINFNCDSHKAQREIPNASEVNRYTKDRIVRSKLIRVGREGKIGRMA